MRAPTAAAQAINAQRRNAITDAVQKVAPAVVTVQTEVVQRVAASPADFFFGTQSGQQVQAGIGSGFIIREDGVIVTNAHVVSGATKISVALRDGTSYPAKLVGIDEQNDLAVLKIDAKKLPVATLGTSRDLLIGEWAIAIGNPFGFILGNTEPSVTAGRDQRAPGATSRRAARARGVYVDMIQTDAAINPGNSGGPLVNALGEVVGVNSSIYSPSGGSVGLGFAIPIDRARRVADDLLAHGKVRKPWIGVKHGVSAADGAHAERARRPARRSARSCPAHRRPRRDCWRATCWCARATACSRTRTTGTPSCSSCTWTTSFPLVVRRAGREIQAKVKVADFPEVNAPARRGAQGPRARSRSRRRSAPSATSRTATARSSRRSRRPSRAASASSRAT